jgi:hypothetical protein
VTLTATGSELGDRGLDQPTVDGQLFADGEVIAIYGSL